MKYKDSIPVYKQVQEIIMHNIESGRWPLHGKLKDEILLSNEFGVSRGTLRRALKDLIDKSILTQIRGKGTFVTAGAIEQPLASRFISFSESLLLQNMSYKTIVIKKELATPDVKTHALLELSNGEKIVYIERVRTVDNIPVIFLKNHVPASMFGGLMEDDLESNTLFSLL